MELELGTCTIDEFLGHVHEFPVVSKHAEFLRLVARHSIGQLTDQFVLQNLNAKKPTSSVSNGQ